MSPCDLPARLGYRFPAEWEPHAATWLSWPHNPDTWPGKFEPVPAVWAELVRTIAPHESVHILAGGEAVMAQARAMVGEVPNVAIHDIATNDCWMRDHGPMFLVGKSAAGQNLPPALVDWEYNAWGGKYPPFDLDNAVPGKLAEMLGFSRWTPGIVLEGGAVDSNGRGTILTTESCLLNPNRNGPVSRESIEQYLRDYCGARKILWLPAGRMAGDDTDGHVDQLARFVGPRTVVASVEGDPADENHAALGENFAFLQSATDQDGRPLEVIPLAMPGAKYFGEHRLPAGYCNFYIANGVIVVPTFDDPADRPALETLGRLFPDRRVVGIGALDQVWGLGAFHCVTQQQPAG